MKYYVKRVTESQEQGLVSDTDGIGVSKKQAVMMARAAAAKYPGHKVFVSWGRASDGQQGYLNPDGNHAITGEAW